MSVWCLVAQRIFDNNKYIRFGRCRTVKCEASSMTSSRFLTRQIASQLLISHPNVVNESFQYPINNFKRALRASVRFSSLYIKFCPSFAFLPVCWIIPGMNDLWWSYTMWAVESSGPTIVKFAQWAGTRRDIFSDGVIGRLSRLHTRVGPDCSSEFLKTVQVTLGSEIELTGEILGSGSIAQVLGGIIKKTGEEVAVKICRKNQLEMVQADLDIFRIFSWLAKKIFFLEEVGLTAAVDEFSKFILPQLDMRVEARNLEKFHACFSSMKSEFKFPKVFHEYSSEDILVESLERGISLKDFLENREISSILPETAKIVADLGLLGFLKMLFDYNFVHGDLHPGNILLKFLPSGKPQMIFLDCGLVSSLARRDFDNFLDLFHAVVTGESSHVGELIIQRSRGNLNLVRDREGFIFGVKDLVENIRRRGKGRIELGTLFGNLFKLACSHRVLLESSFVSTCCSLMVLEGVGKSIDPERDLIESAKPFIVKAFQKRRVGFHC